MQQSPTNNDWFTAYTDPPNNTDPYMSVGESGLANTYYSGPSVAAQGTAQQVTVGVQHMHTDTVQAYDYDITQNDTFALGAVETTTATSAGPIPLTIADNTGASLGGKTLAVSFVANVSAEHPGFFRTPTLVLASTYLTVAINAGGAPGLLATSGGATVAQDPNFGVTADADNSTFTVDVTLPNVTTLPVAIGYISTLTSGSAAASGGLFDFGTNNTTVQLPGFDWTMSYTLEN
jgi:hypothetical protein